jgi:hypothetical protein
VGVTVPKRKISVFHVPQTTSTSAPLSNTADAQVNHTHTVTSFQRNVLKNGCHRDTKKKYFDGRKKKLCQETRNYFYQLCQEYTKLYFYEIIMEALVNASDSILCMVAQRTTPRHLTLFLHGQSQNNTNPIRLYMCMVTQETRS